ncbi:MAG: biotin--[acetyl-CoA-carboxylase] ligase [Bacteroidota bacterium]
MQNNTFSTLFIAQKLIHLEAVDSTNNYLKVLLSKSEPLAEGTVILADNQFSGRGQRGNTWLSEPGLNLTFSILLNPTLLKVEHQFKLNMAVSIGIKNALCKYVPEEIKVKWPNDIYFGKKKIGGVLIENTLQGNVIKHSIIGIGINVNQREFGSLPNGRASSIAEILQQDVDLRTILEQICHCIEAQYLRLLAGSGKTQHQEYLNCLYLYGLPSTFKSSEGNFVGIISDVANTGELLLKTEEGDRHFGFKEIEFLD